MNQADLSPNPGCSSSLLVEALILSFCLFWFVKYAMLTRVNRTIATLMTSKVIVADVYCGAGDREPRSHVARMPPELLIMKPIAIAVARRVCGAALFEPHEDTVGATVYVPGIEKNSEPYLTEFELEPARI
jgi:hypothetical protein